MSRLEETGTTGNDCSPRAISNFRLGNLHDAANRAATPELHPCIPLPALETRNDVTCLGFAPSVNVVMSYYFAIVGTKDNPLFEHEFGTSKQGGDGVARFPEQARHMNQFIVHSSLDMVEEVQWASGQMCVSAVAMDSWPS